MKRPLRLSVGRFAIAIVTIFAITGTLSSCGRYGSPVRVVPAADTANANGASAKVDADADADADVDIEGESSDESDRSGKSKSSGAR